MHGEPKSDDDKEPVTVDFSKWSLICMAKRSVRKMKHGSKGILLAKPACNLWNKITLLDVALIHEDNQPATLIRIATKIQSIPTLILDNTFAATFGFKPIFIH